MIKPEPRIVKMMATVVRQHPELLEWLDSWRLHELEQLPSALTHTAVSQGRCQVLGELYRFAKNSPELAAKL